jgi:hypothetical protein
MLFFGLSQRVRYHATNRSITVAAQKRRIPSRDSMERIRGQDREVPRT